MRNATTSLGVKIILKIFIITFLILIINPLYAIEKSSIILEKEPLIKNTDKNITQAKSIENEVTQFRKNLILIQKKYKLKNDKTINDSIKDIGEIIYILRKIQTTKINKNTADNVIKIVINDLKNINYKTKKYLKTYIDNLKIKLKIDKDKYNKISNNLYIKLKNITLSFIKYYQNKKIITKKDKEIIKVVQNIYAKSLKLKEFKNKIFYTKEEMKNYLIKILKDLKQDFKEIRKISQKR